MIHLNFKDQLSDRDFYYAQKHSHLIHFNLKDQLSDQDFYYAQKQSYLVLYKSTGVIVGFPATFAVMGCETYY